MTVLSVAVIAGGPSAEANVSRTSARAVSAALEAAGHRATIIELDAELPAALKRGQFAVVFPVTHGPVGEDGCLQGLLEVLNVRYVGSGVLASALAASKPHAKALFRLAGLPVADEVLLVDTDDASAVARVHATLGRSVVVKPASGGSAIGTTRVGDAEPDAALAEAIAAARAVDPRVLVERFIVGNEVTCGVLEDQRGVRALPPTLIVSKAADWYDFESRYKAGGSEHQCPAPLADAVTRRIQEVALGAYEALGCRDLGRVDFVVGDAEDGSEVTLLEVNTLPGMTATSLYPEAARAEGLGFPELCSLLARRAAERPLRSAPTELAMP